VLMLNPIVPHICHTLWPLLGGTGDVLNAPWPKIDESALTRDTIEMVVQVKGKVRAKISVAADADEATIRETALAQDNVSRFVAELGEYSMKVVPGKLVSIFPKK
jgi:leucyl-tRNA synthetase